MVVSKEIRKEILEAISEIGENVATIGRIEKKVPYERHTLSKYLHLMRRMGYLDFVAIGKAKVWHINKAPLKSVLQTDAENMSFSEQLLYDIIENMPGGIILIDAHFNVIFMNRNAEEKFGDIVGTKLYKSLFGSKNPLRLKKIIEVIDKKSKNARFVAKDKYNNILRIRVTRFINPNEEISLILVVEDITQLRKVRQKARKVQAFCGAMLDNLEFSLLFVDENLKILEVSQEALKLFGVKKPKLLGADLSYYLEGIKPGDFKSEVRKKMTLSVKGRKIPLEVRAVPVNSGILFVLK